MFPVVIRNWNEDDMMIDVSRLLVLTCNTYATGRSIYEVLDHEMEKRGRLWTNCIAFGGDNASVMTGCNKGVIAFIRKQHPQIYLSECPCHLLHFNVQRKQGVNWKQE